MRGKLDKCLSHMSFLLIPEEPLSQRWEPNRLSQTRVQNVAKIDSYFKQIILKIFSFDQNRIQLPKITLVRK